jgi:putative endonuclease
MENTLSIGNKGEEIATEYLVKNGYAILHKNWRYKHLEIDIIAREKNELVIVEVKTRKNADFEGPNDVVTKKKQKYLIDATSAYIDEYDIDLETRFDIIHIINQGMKPSIEHIKDAFYPQIR